RHRVRGHRGTGRPGLYPQAHWPGPGPGPGRSHRRTPGRRAEGQQHPARRGNPPAPAACRDAPPAGHTHGKVRLRRNPAPRWSWPKLPEYTTGMDQEPHKLLIVDDDETFSRVLARALSSRGFEVETASDADSAVVAARRLRPTFCVLDLKLGENNGLRLIPDLKAVVPGMRILLLTGYASIATAVEAIKRGAHDYLAKPVDADAVARALLDHDGGADDD